MPHGTPDWGLVGPKSTVHGLDDLGELAVRLGSPVVWDRRGDQVFATDFRHGVGDVHLPTSGLGSDVILHTGEARQGAYCVQLTAGRTGDRYASIEKDLPFPVAGRIGFEITFSFEAHTQHIELFAHLRNAIGLWEPRLTLDPNTGDLYVQTAPLGAPVLITDEAYVKERLMCMNTMKMVFDLTRVLGVYTGYYVRAVVNDTEYDLSAHPIEFTAGAQTPWAQFTAYHYADAGENPVGYMDCFIVTQNEP